MTYGTAESFKKRVTVCACLDSVLPTHKERVKKPVPYKSTSNTFPQSGHFLGVNAMLGVLGEMPSSKINA